MKNFLNKYLPKKKLEILLVLMQFLLIVLQFFNFVSFLSNDFLYTYTNKEIFGLLIIFFGFILLVISIKNLGKNISPFAKPKKDGSLVTKGIYKYILHPMYYSTIIVSIGIVIINSTFLNLLLTMFLIILLRIKINIEENYLKNKYKNYNRYKRDLKI
tara:strand:- start:1761 stop:2234 length:474 start_codon:yes stop_codon:yes gene_type:complete